MTSAAGPYRRLPGRAVVFSVGSNLGDRLEHLRGAVAGLAALDGVSVTAVSPVYETAPVGGPPQGDYLNAVVLGVTELSSLALLTRTQRLEAAAGRVRGEPLGPRTLDIDLVAVGDEVSSDGILTLPHPRAHERAFVLVPWLAADPLAVFPGRGPVTDVLAGLPATATTGVRRFADHLTPV